MVPNFFWDYVRRPQKVGSKKDADLENVPLSAGHEILFDNLCNVEGKHDYFERFDVRNDEDDDDLVYVVSSTFGGEDCDGDLRIDDNEGPGEVDDWKQLDESSRDVKIGESLKRLGNVRKKCMSKDILCDMLGVDGDKAVVGEKEAQEEKLKKERQKLNILYLSVLHFDRKMKKRRQNHDTNLSKSTNKTFTRKSYRWRDRFDEIRREKNSKV